MWYHGTRSEIDLPQRIGRFLGKRDESSVSTWLIYGRLSSKYEPTFTSIKAAGLTDFFAMFTKDGVVDVQRGGRAGVPNMVNRAKAKVANQSQHSGPPRQDHSLSHNGVHSLGGRNPELGGGHGWVQVRWKFDEVVASRLVQ